ncbi:DUF6249 domain-containing protein [Porticoccaceae bacterium]|nr:hypothetical protein [Porticoccaceae bacterium]MDC3200723.1 DUF6249 domain-containing protein [Porticoccaceae bacterium]
MKTRRLKPFLFVIALYLIPFGMVSTALTTPVFANETSLSEEHVSNTPATIPQDAEENKTWEETQNHGSNDENTTIIFKLGEDEGAPEKYVFVEAKVDAIDIQKIQEGGSDEHRFLEFKADTIDVQKIQEGGSDEHRFLEFKADTIDAQKIHEGGSDEHRFLKFKADAEGVKILSETFSKLIETEWSDLEEAEKEKILEALKEIEAGIEVDIYDDSSDTSATDAIIAIVAIMFSLGSPILIIGIILYYKHRKRRQHNALIEKFLDSGQEIPTEILASGDLADSSSNTLSRGIKLTAIGLGLYIFLGSLIGWDIATVALIPLFIGIARIVIWKLSDKTSSSTE